MDLWRFNPKRDWIRKFLKTGKRPLAVWSILKIELQVGTLLVFTYAYISTVEHGPLQALVNVIIYARGFMGNPPWICVILYPLRWITTFCYLTMNRGRYESMLASISYDWHLVRPTLSPWGTLRSEVRLAFHHRKHPPSMCHTKFGHNDNIYFCNHSKFHNHSLHILLHQRRFVHSIRNKPCLQLQKTIINHFCKRTIYNQPRT